MNNNFDEIMMNEQQLSLATIIKYSTIDNVVPCWSLVRSM